MECTAHEAVYMRTSIVIDDQLVADAMKLSGAKTKREVVECFAPLVTSASGIRQVIVATATAGVCHN